MNKKVAIFGGSLGNNVSGYGWAKHNIAEALSPHMDVISVYWKREHNSGGVLTPDQVVSRESRDGTQFVVDEVGITSIQEWQDFVDFFQPDLVISVGDQDRGWFVPVKTPKHTRSVGYFLTEAPTMNRYIPASNVRNEQGKPMYLDLERVFAQYSKVIPASEITKFALIHDCGFDAVQDITPITPPVWKWETSNEKAREYREKRHIPENAKLYFTVAVNNVRKRMDQLLLYFHSEILKKEKPCCTRLVIHTVNADGYDLTAIIDRLGLTGKVIVDYTQGRDVMEGVFSAGNVFISLPAAEGYGLPFHESLLLGKQTIHSGVGWPVQTAKQVKGQSIDIVEAKHPYFYKIGNQIWYAIGSNPTVRRFGKKGNADIKGLINTPQQFKNKMLTELSEVMGDDITSWKVEKLEDEE